MSQINVVSVGLMQALRTTFLFELYLNRNNIIFELPASLCLAQCYCESLPDWLAVSSPVWQHTAACCSSRSSPAWARRGRKQTDRWCTSVSLAFVPSTSQSSWCQPPPARSCSSPAGAALSRRASTASTRPPPTRGAGSLATSCCRPKECCSGRMRVWTKRRATRFLQRQKQKVHILTQIEEYHTTVWLTNKLWAFNWSIPALKWSQGGLNVRLVYWLVITAQRLKTNKHVLNLPESHVPFPLWRLMRGIRLDNNRIQSRPVWNLCQSPEFSPIYGVLVSLLHCGLQCWIHLHTIHAPCPGVFISWVNPWSWEKSCEDHWPTCDSVIWHKSEWEQPLKKKKKTNSTGSLEISY